MPSRVQRQRRNRPEQQQRTVRVVVASESDNLLLSVDAIDSGRCRPTYDEPLLLRQNRLVYMPGSVQVRQHDGAHGSTAHSLSTCCSNVCSVGGRRQVAGSRLVAGWSNIYIKYIYTQKRIYTYAAGHSRATITCCLLLPHIKRQQETIASQENAATQCSNAPPAFAVSKVSNDSSSSSGWQATS